MMAFGRRSLIMGCASFIAFSFSLMHLNGSRTVLVVDDESVVRASISAALKRRGYSVVVAHGGVEGLHRFAENRDKIDLILADVVMPDLDGPSMVEVIRRENPNMKVIFITGYRDRLPDWALESCGLLLKPFNAAKLVAAVDQSLKSDSLATTQD